MTRVISIRNEMTHGSFCRGGSFLCITPTLYFYSVLKRAYGGSHIVPALFVSKPLRPGLVRLGVKSRDCVV